MGRGWGMLGAVRTSRKPTALAARESATRPRGCVCLPAPFRVFAHFGSDDRTRALADARRISDICLSARTRPLRGRVHPNTGVHPHTGVTPLTCTPPACIPNGFHTSTSTPPACIPNSFHTSTSTPPACAQRVRASQTAFTPSPARDRRASQARHPARARCAGTCIPRPHAQRAHHPGLRNPSLSAPPHRRCRSDGAPRLPARSTSTDALETGTR
jgi:hypothetical protein